MDSQYQLKLKSQQNEKVYIFRSADGLNSKNSFHDEELLLADELNIGEDDRMLVIQSNYGFLGVVLGDKAGKVVMFDTSARSCEFSRKNAEKNDLENYSVENLPRISELDGSFDKIVYAPADYEPVDLVKDRLADAVEKLSKGGELYIAGRKKSGLKRYRKNLESYGEVKRLVRDGATQICSFRKDSGETPSGLDLERSFEAEVDGIEADFRTSEGLFSAGKLDEGTRILLENTESDISEADEVLELACGYGAISVFLGKMYEFQLYLKDDDTRAVEYAGKNLGENGIEGSEVEAADCLDGFEDKKFDFVVSNPPTHQGSGVTDKMFRQVYESLFEGGEFWLVYNQNMGYEDQLSERFNLVETVAKEGNFIVVRAVK
jgi:16S rRNA (guanine1207-N2)-methyltransferase